MGGPRERGTPPPNWSDHWTIGSLTGRTIGSLDHWITGSLDHGVSFLIHVSLLIQSFLIRLWLACFLLACGFLLLYLEGNRVNMTIFLSVGYTRCIVYTVYTKGPWHHEPGFVFLKGSKTWLVNSKRVLLRSINGIVPMLSRSHVVFFGFLAINQVLSWTTEK